LKDKGNRKKKKATMFYSGFSSKVTLLSKCVWRIPDKDDTEKWEEVVEADFKVLKGSWKNLFFSPK